MNIKFSPPDIGQQEIDEVVDTLKSGWITTGPKAKRFEREAAAYCGTEKAVALNSATAGLELVLRLLGIGSGDEVITSAYSYTASASVIAHVGAKIVLVDTDPGSYFAGIGNIERAITKKTKAIIPVDIGGSLFDYERLTEVVETKKHLFCAGSPMQEKLGRIAIIADAAHSFGAERGGRKSGCFADFTVFSLHAVKNLTTAEGGIVVWDGRLNSAEIYEQLMLLSLHGQNKDALSKTKLGSWEYDIKCLGYKCNMTDILASIGLVQLNRYPDLVQRRAQVMDLYKRGLSERVEVFAHQRSVYHLALTRVSGCDEAARNRIIELFAEKGIATNVHYKQLPMHTAYKALGFDVKDFPNSYHQYENEITLPLHTLLTDNEVEYIIEMYNDIVGSC
jgi:dTDP-4-amino-4,6-dideoxygalactose transaminase